MEGGSNVDGDESEGTSPSRQGPDIGILVPHSLSAMAAKIGIASGEKGSGIRVFATRVKIRAKGATRGGPSRPGGLVAWPPPRPRGVAASVTGGPPPALLQSFWKVPSR